MKQLSIKELDETARALSNENSLNEGDAFILVTGIKDEQEHGTRTSTVIRGMGSDIMMLLNTILDDEEMRMLLFMAIQSRKWNEDE